MVAKINKFNILLFFIAFLQLFISLWSVTMSWVSTLVLLIGVTYGVFHILRSIENKKEKPKK